MWWLAFRDLNDAPFCFIRGDMQGPGDGGFQVQDVAVFSFETA